MRVSYESRIVNPGEFREQLSIQRKVVSGQNSFGEDVYTWSTLVVLKARVKSLKGKEIEQAANQTWAESEYEIEMHWFAGITTAMRALWLTAGVQRPLSIIDISDPWGSGRYMTIWSKDYPTTSEVAA